MRPDVRPLPFPSSLPSSPGHGKGASWRSRRSETGLLHTTLPAVAARAQRRVRPKKPGAGQERLQPSGCLLAALPTPAGPSVPTAHSLPLASLPRAALTGYEPRGLLREVTDELGHRLGWKVRLLAPPAECHPPKDPWQAPCPTSKVRLSLSVPVQNI